MNNFIFGVATNILYFIEEIWSILIYHDFILIYRTSHAHEFIYENGITEKRNNFLANYLKQNDQY